jgi:hypothetical protein
MNKIIKNSIKGLTPLIALFFYEAGYYNYQRHFVEKKEYVSNPVLGYGNPRALYSAEELNQRSFGLHKIGEVSDENIKIERFQRRARFNSPLASVIFDGLGNIKNVTLHLQEGTDIPEYCPVRR